MIAALDGQLHVFAAHRFVEHDLAVHHHAADERVVYAPVLVDAAMPGASCLVTGIVVKVAVAEVVTPGPGRVFDVALGAHHQ